MDKLYKLIEQYDYFFLMCCISYREILKEIEKERQIMMSWEKQDELKEYLGSYESSWTFYDRIYGKDEQRFSKHPNNCRRIRRTIYERKYDNALEEKQYQNRLKQIERIAYWAKVDNVEEEKINRFFETYQLTMDEQLYFKSLLR